MQAVLVQPPFTQLNAPYPAVHYLEAFLRDRGIEARAFDHGIELYRRIFSRAGLERAFARVRQRRTAPRGDCGGGARDEDSERELARYLSYESLYLDWIDPVMRFLGGGDPAFAHRLAQAVELPMGRRTSAFLDAEGGRISTDQARALATRLLEDLGDFVTVYLDPEFGTVRYGERLASSRGDFGEIRGALETSYVLGEFYRPMLEEFWRNELAAQAELVLISVPFPGCLLGALACAEAARSTLGPAALILLGGGYVSTELRGLCDPDIFDYCDYLCFDAGYGCLASILDGREQRIAASSTAARAAPAGPAQGGAEPRGLYRCMHRLDDGRIAVSGFPRPDADRPAADPSARVIIECREAERYRALELSALSSIYPDYRSVHFGSYLGVVDSANPMHRLWSDAPWLKFHLAYGCYWKRCTFCDTQLDYVSGFAQGDIAALLGAAEAAAAASGLGGIHFVDEAMPMHRLLAFVDANRARAATGGSPFSFWGNVRFDSTWTRGRCEYLSAGGLVAVSGGIEIATERGLAMTDKGFDLAGLVRCLVAMKRSGILVHAYLIYGFPGQTEAELVDSAEVCRQLFAAGLVDSAFWHRFVLTRHSRMYGEWVEGKRPRLRPVDAPRRFADNDLSFAGERDFDRFDAPLAASLAAWMEGESLERPVAAWFGSGRRAAVPAPSVPPGLIESLIARNEADAGAAEAGDRVHWIAGLPVVREDDADPARPTALLGWAYRGGMEEVRLPPAAARRAQGAVLALAGSAEGQRLSTFTEALGPEAAPAFDRLADAGLVIV